MKRSNLMPESAIQVAKAGRPHGVRGELRLVPESGRPERLLDLSALWFMDATGSPEHFDVASIRMHSGAALVRLVGLEDRDEAARLTNRPVFGDPAELPPLEAHEFDASEVVGCTLVDGDVPVGRIAALVTNAGRDLFEVEVGERLVLVPAVLAWLIEADIPGRRISMRLPEGLLDE